MSNVLEMPRAERERREKILRMLQSSKGGYTRKTLEALGVPWAPPKGWKKRLLADMPKAPRKAKGKPARKAKRHRPAPQGKSFYKSAEWARLRYDALKASKGCCELCGRSSNDGAILQVDHIKPVSTHWELRNKPSNLQVLCSLCNWGKGAQDDTDWREPDVRALMGERLS